MVPSDLLNTSCSLCLSPFYVLHLTPWYFILLFLFSLLPIFLPPIHLLFHLMPALWKQLFSGSLILVSLVMALVMAIPSLHLYQILLHNILTTLQMRQTNDSVISHHITSQKPIMLKNKMFCPLEKINITILLLSYNLRIKSERFNVTYKPLLKQRITHTESLHSYPQISFFLQLLYFLWRQFLFCFSFFLFLFCFFTKSLLQHTKTVTMSALHYV